MMYLEKGSKFWRCTLEGTTTTMVFGTIGTPGQNRVKVHPSQTVALAYMTKMRDQKVNKEGFAPKAAGGARGRGGAPAPAEVGAKAKAKARAEGKAKARAEPKARAVPQVKAGARAKALMAKAAAKRGSSGDDEGPATKRAKAEAKSGARASSSRRGGGGGGKQVDSRCPKSGLKVYEDYSVKLNQTNVGANNNKFYIIQVLEGDGAYYAWNRWGRVGDVGQNKLLPCSTVDKAIKEFESKFRQKTKNAWAQRDHFHAHKGSYTLVETEETGGGGEEQAPMGKLTAAQIQKGQSVLEKLSTALNKRNEPQIADLSSEFYSLIPTNFGWKKPVAISTRDMLEEKQELLKFFLRMGFETVESDTGVSPIDGVMELPVPKSLDDAAAGVCAGAHVTASNKKGRELAAKQAGRPKAKMGEALYAAIMLYTSNAIYTDLNKCLRDKNRAKIKKYFKYLRLLLEAMTCLPQQKRTLWRGISVDLSSDPQYAPGQTVTWWGVSSCTSDQKVAQGFAHSCGGGASVITIQASTACDISAISFFGNEKESLLRPGTQLKVKSRTSKGGITEVTLQEVGSAIN